MRVISWATKGYKSLSKSHAANEAGVPVCGAKVPQNAASVRNYEEKIFTCNKCRAKMGVPTPRFSLFVMGEV